MPERTRHKQAQSQAHSQADAALRLEDLLGGLKAAGEPTRLRLLHLLARAELTVTELTQILGQSQPRVSRHLKLMCEAGLIERFREGTWAFYRLADGGAGAALAARLVGLVAPGDQTLDRDRGRLDQIKDARAAAAAAYFRGVAGDWDRVRALTLPEQDVETAMLAAVAAGNSGSGHDADGGVLCADMLDVGTGTGRVLEVFAPHVERGTGIDSSREMLAVARSGLEKAGLDHCQVRQADMYNLPFPADAVDLVTIHQVLHYADDPAAAVAEAARVLRPGGKLLIVDFLPHDQEFLRHEHAHRRLGFSDDEVTGWCRAAGLKPEPPRHLAGGQLTVALWLAKDARQGPVGPAGSG